MFDVDCRKRLPSSPFRRGILVGAFVIESVIAQSVFAQCGVSFSAPATFTSGQFSNSVAAGDVNADGKLDLAVANYDSNTVAVHLGNGSGTFGPAINSPAIDGPYDVAFADLNSDTKPDIVVTSIGNLGNANLVSVLIGNGNGSFASPVSYTTGSFPGSLAVADLNADGKPDVVVVNFETNSVSVFLGNGNGTLQSRVDYATGNGASSVAARDVNGDAKPDLLVSCYFSNAVSVLLGNGNGTFQSKIDYATGTTPLDLAVGDLNADGKPDLVLATSTKSSSGKVSVLLGNGDGTFQTYSDYTAGPGLSSIVLEDLNGDGKIDVAATLSGNDLFDHVSVLLGNGNGGLESVIGFASSGLFPSSVAASDVNADGKSDLFMVEGYGVTILLNTGPSIGINPQPLSQSVPNGGTATFTAGATGTGPFTYQWRRNGVPIIGATRATITVPSVSPAVFGAYDVQVSGGCNPSALVTSKPAILGPNATCPSDLNGDGATNTIDLTQFLGRFGLPCP